MDVTVRVLSLYICMYMKYDDHVIRTDCGRWRRAKAIIYLLFDVICTRQLLTFNKCYQFIELNVVQNVINEPKNLIKNTET